MARTLHRPPGTRARICKTLMLASSTCCACEGPIKNEEYERVIANVYEGQRWDRLEEFHVGCYRKIGQPYGPAPRTPEAQLAYDRRVGARRKGRRAA